jgi:hypothetical protein
VYFKLAHFKGLPAVLFLLMIRKKSLERIIWVWLPVLSLAAKFMPSFSSTVRAKKANLPLLATAAALKKKSEN